MYEPLRMWSSLLQKEGWELPKPSNEAYNVSWCGWGYEFNVTPKQMLGTAPKLKELGIKWATLDDRWFDTTTATGIRALIHFPAIRSSRWWTSFTNKGFSPNFGGFRWEWKMGKEDMSLTNISSRRWCRSIRIG